MKKYFYYPVYIIATVISIIVTFTLISRYVSNLMPFSNIDWLLLVSMPLSILWSEKLMDYSKRAIIMEFIITATYLISFGALFSMIVFQCAREMKDPGLFFGNSGWIMAATFVYILIVGPIAQFRRDIE